MQTTAPEYVVDAAKRLGLTRQRVHQMIDEGRLTLVAWGPRGRLVDGADVDREIERREAAG